MVRWSFLGSLRYLYRWGKTKEFSLCCQNPPIQATVLACDQGTVYGIAPSVPTRQQCQKPPFHWSSDGGFASHPHTCSCDPNSYLLDFILISGTMQQWQFISSLFINSALNSEFVYNLNYLYSIETKCFCRTQTS